MLNWFACLWLYYALRRLGILTCVFIHICIDVQCIANIWVKLWYFGEIAYILSLWFDNSVVADIVLIVWIEITAWIAITIGRLIEIVVILRIIRPSLSLLLLAVVVKIIRIIVVTIIGVKLVILIVVLVVTYISRVTLIGIVAVRFIALSRRNIRSVSIILWLNVRVVGLILGNKILVLNLRATALILRYRTAKIMFAIWVVIYFFFYLFSINLEHTIQCTMLDVAADVRLYIKQNLSQRQHLPFLQILKYRIYLEDLAFEIKLGHYVYSFEKIPTKFVELLKVVYLSRFSEP